MPIISPNDRKGPKGRTITAGIYLALIIGGLTMVYPFMIMLTGSTGTSFDFERRSVLPRWVVSREDRFMRVLVTFFPPAHRASIRQLRCYFPNLPDTWQLWTQMGDDAPGTDKWARQALQRLEDPAERKHLEAAAQDYGEFTANWNARETVLAYDARYIAPFLRERYKTLENFNKAWEVSIDDFPKVNAGEWSGEPIDQSGYVPLEDQRYSDLLLFREAYRANRFTPYLGGKDAPAGYLRPAALRFLWEDFAGAQAGKTDVAYLRSLPFPVPADAPPEMRATWYDFLKSAFPMRHLAVRVDDARRVAFRRFVETRFRTPDYMNRVLETTATSFDEIALTPIVPKGPAAKVWMDFVRTEIPVEEWQIRDTLPEQAFQQFVLARHGSLEKVNEAYGTRLANVQQLGIPFGEALLVTFANRERSFTMDLLTANYRTVFEYLFHRGRAVSNTIILVTLAILVTLTVNPLAAYALSRFRLRSTEKIIVFCLATMAFPAAVAAIPGFLLLRDMGLLNTFAALVLPGAANGMTIFLLKGFFDSLPKELYEAATIDGAPEWQVFLQISLPLVKPILAVSMLHAFIASYNGWEWAIIVCQDPKMWTVSVWTYQFYQTLSGAPYTVMAAFIINSIPVLLIFLFCQKIILRGIILPQLK